jgi:hypothetical protein
MEDKLEEGCLLVIWNLLKQQICIFFQAKPPLENNLGFLIVDQGEHVGLNVLMTPKTNESIMTEQQFGNGIYVVLSKLPHCVCGEEGFDIRSVYAVDVPGQGQSKGTGHFHRFDVANIEHPNLLNAISIRSSKLLLHLSQGA